MRWLKFSTADGTAYGILEGERVLEVKGDPFSGYEKTSRVHALNDVKIEVPVEPRTFYCAGKNYVAHVIQSAKRRGVEPNIPQKPDIGYRANNALIAHNEPVVLPPDAANIAYEGELVVVIGKKVKHVSESDALSCIMGYTIGNDISERDWQRSDRTFWRSKNTDTFKPMGPWIETDVNLEAMETAVRLNGGEQVRFKTNAMLFGVATYISTMTRYLTLHPGDVIWMGTDGASPVVKPGDVVEIDITGIGTLRNPFVLGAAV
ncbi:MAG: 2-keto-4-pentenoate hydratase [Betaproteobacteria bacterium RIFCSPLOWO2_12_FULL_62_13]|nr:MAG: 2-keto-4-pentenoate hydratase [Betaproteobacteria bacterium RIFCSPLOWO2_12_FULL_62_13]